VENIIPLQTQNVKPTIQKQLVLDGAKITLHFRSEGNGYALRQAKSILLTAYSKSATDPQKAFN